MLTDAEIQRALRTGMDTQLSDGSGKGKGRLVLIIRSKRAHWYAQQWIAGKKRLKKMGTYPRLTLAEARRKYESDYAEVIEAGTDIRITEAAKRGTLKDLFEDYLSSLEAAGKPSAKETRYNLTEVLEHLDGRKQASEIRTDDLLTVLRPIWQRGSPGRADHMRGHIRAAFQFGMRADADYRSDNPKRYNIEANPAAPIPPEKKKAGNRFLSVDELRAFWRWLHDLSPYNPRAGHGMVESNLVCLRVLMLTGQRVEMISQLRPEQFNGQMLEWEKTKNGLPHVLPLPDQAIPLLTARVATNYRWLFPSVFNPEIHIRKELLQDITKRFCERSGVARFTPRDLRRTWKTQAGFAKISKGDRDLIQCHIEGDVSSRHYDRYEYLDEKTAAMKRWSEWFRDTIEN